MRIFELSTRISNVSRRDGRSATSAAAYRACCAIHCQREDRLHDYTRKRGLEVSRIVAPNGSPSWATDRSALWNAAELRERNGTRGPNAGRWKADARTAREFMFAFPAELSAAGRLAVATTVARHLADTHGLVADFSIHQPGREGDERNVHCHMLTTTRRMTADGLGEKIREWDALGSGGTLAKAFGAYLAATLNEALAAEGQGGAVRVEHRSFKARGSPQRPQLHMGPKRTNAIRRQQRQARQAWHAAHLRDQRERHEMERTALEARQQRALEQKVRELSDRERQAGAAFAEAARSSAPGKPGLIQRLSQAFGRQAAPEIRSPSPSVARQNDLQAERAAYLAIQARERQALDARQQAEDRQLATATDHRVAHGRLVEQQHRRDHAQDREDRQRTVAPIEQENSRDLTP